MPQDLAKASEWYQKAADAGNPLAMANIAFFLATGKAGKTDVPGAVDMFFKSLSAGDAPSDDFNRDYVMAGDWGEAFYTALQESLAAAGTYHGRRPAAPMRRRASRSPPSADRAADGGRRGRPTLLTRPFFKVRGVFSSFIGRATAVLQPFREPDDRFE